MDFAAATHCLYMLYFDTGKGGGEKMNYTEGYRGNSSQSWVENTTVTDCISVSPVYKLK
jgi:hypothetical protein